MSPNLKDYCICCNVKFRVKALVSLLKSIQAPNMATVQYCVIGTENAFIGRDINYVVFDIAEAIKFLDSNEDY